MTGSGVADVAVRLAVELVRIDSVNPGLVPGAAGEAAVVDRLAHRLAARGFDVAVVPAAGATGRPSLLATHRGSGGGRTLALNGHLDTVGVAGMAEPFAGRIVGDRLQGRGACDMKGGVAAMVAAAEAAAASGTAGDVVLALVADEEHASVGTEAVLGRLAGRLPDACLVGEPTELDLAVAHRGYSVVEVSLTGRAAHSSQPADGVNAVVHLGRLLAAVEARDAELAAGPAHPVVGTGSLMSTVVRGGTSPFVLADAASAVVERRTVPGEPATVGLDEVERILGALRRDDPCVEGRAALALAREPWEHDGTSPAGSELATVLTDALAGCNGRRPDGVGVPYWMESALWEGAGVPTVVCGPAGGGLHAADEWGDLRQLRGYAEALVVAIDRFCRPLDADN
ncbi:M20/M25/M40 family metallo-hydrolase [Blastococcus tunisiensis]|uniref:M20/M25/M40 family metallo-hydrolase n=1 Tax=Blastococcus tunisiensis TaxID=1798228 RepID=UPI0015875262|nr:M20/M25/M40 family metallo-hydrolase [Blastococcus sp. DSM 46838]